eukprot:gb/GECG01014520.1/.p1 GENE.gb/GECG01014520.1/~~gb/GECG01014520.1/.p1  ORF type:complete len:180 (+),score=10.94 gb/GECG01014520.1/:1-540(+)
MRLPLLVFVLPVLVLVLGEGEVDQKPQFHVMPRRNWCNDPNGPTYWKGVYHLFFQYNPNAPVWGDMHWGHVVSEDLSTWRHMPVALAPDKEYDSKGVFSGSITIVNGFPVISYTCVNSQNQQLQCQAYPKNASDPYLREWYKDDNNPLISQAPPVCWWYATSRRDDGAVSGSLHCVVAE